MSYTYTHDGQPRVMDWMQKITEWLVINPETGEVLHTAFNKKDALRARVRLEASVDQRHPLVFQDTRIGAMLRLLLRAGGEWVSQPECSRYYGVGEYGRSDLYHRQAGDHGYIVYEDRATGGVSKSRSHPGRPVKIRYWRWNLGSIEDYMKMLSDDELNNAFMFCERGMLRQVPEINDYREGGRVFTSPEQWGEWLTHVNQELRRRSFV